MAEDEVVVHWRRKHSQNEVELLLEARGQRLHLYVEPGRLADHHQKIFERSVNMKMPEPEWRKGPK
jgi:hypothetical protein